MAPSKTPPLERLKARTVFGDCWTATFSPEKRGYMRISLPGRRREGVHVFAYKLFVGAIPDGMTVDHICFNTACWRPDHLQLLTRSENAKRCRRAMATHCKRGHPYTDHRRNGSRECLVCRRENAKVYQRQLRKRRREARLAD
ncbi:HNH endonuclease signature motif containing protein [Streptomyces cinereoruber]|uniref:HNH endonuclease signature motif containing protein n=1 Tax=Streptomyces cinereoruber TaxID=67260 RepID=UPI00364CA202